MRFDTTLSAGPAGHAQRSENFRFLILDFRFRISEFWNRRNAMRFRTAFLRPVRNRKSKSKIKNSAMPFLFGFRSGGRYRWRPRRVFPAAQFNVARFPKSDFPSAPIWANIKSLFRKFLHLPS